MLELLLASQSPRRRELLSALGMPTTFVDIDANEAVEETLAPTEVAEAKALKKATAYDKTQLTERQVLITADTVVISQDCVLGKPKDRDQAIAMLRMLSGSWHQVCTGVCLVTHTQKRSFTETTRVHFQQLSEEDILHYVNLYHPYDKAGSYGIQEWIGLIGIDHIDGCYYNVMGLPTARLYSELKTIEN